MNRRGLKQLGYGLFFIAVVALVFGGVYFLFFRAIPSCFDNVQNQGETGIDCGGPCVLCDIKYASPVTSAWVRGFSNSGKLLLAAEITNPNSTVGASDFISTFNVYDKDGNTIASVSDHSFIYASGIKYILEPVVVNDGDFDHADVSFSNFTWKSAGDFSSPNIILKDSRTDIYNPAQGLVPSTLFTGFLALKDANDNVLSLNNFLKSQGFFTVTSTNVFTKDTQKALTAYQKANQIAATGKFDQATLDSVNAKIQAVKNSLASQAAVYPLVVAGTVKNSDVVTASRVIISAFVCDKGSLAAAPCDAGAVLGVSKTEIDNMNPTDEIAFKIIMPSDINTANVDPTRTKIYIDAIR